MVKTISLLPGVTLRMFQDNRFKQSCLTVQFVRPMCREEVAYNALLPAVLLRGCEGAEDMRDITLRLDDLYGASVSTLVRRVGDYQTVGLHCGFIEDNFAMAGDKIFAPMVAFLRQLIFAPVLENGVFRKDYVNHEKKNLIINIESARNDKRSYAMAELFRIMCREDSYGIPRLGEVSQVEKITPEELYAHYRRVLRESPVEIFYVGSKDATQVEELLRPLFADTERNYVNLNPQTDFQSPEGGEQVRAMDVAQGRLAMGFATPVTNRDPRFAAMQVCNTVFGGGVTGKLFANVREKNSLCYDIGSSYYGSKGIVTVGAGIDFDKKDDVKAQVLAQLEACQRGEISQEELAAAKGAMISGLRSIHDSVNAIENYYSTAALSGLNLTPAQYRQAVEAVTLREVADVANTLRLHTTFFIKGEK